MFMLQMCNKIALLTDMCISGFLSVITTLQGITPNTKENYSNDYVVELLRVTNAY